MHIPGGVLDQAPCIATAMTSAAAVGYGLYRLRREMSGGAVLRIAATAALVFAAQMINVPVTGGTSGHVVGGVLAVALLGPWGGLLAMSVVLLVQCLLFQDGGLTALGANVLNMGVVGTLGGYLVYAFVRRHIGGARGAIVGSVVASWLAVMVAALFCAVEIASGGKVSLFAAIGAMLPVHALIGAGEAAVTGLAVAMVVKRWPHLLYDPQRTPAIAHAPRATTAVLLVALTLAAFVSPWASALPDGLDSSLSRLQMEHAITPLEWPAPFKDYQFPSIGDSVLSGSMAAIAGTLAVFAAAGLVALVLPRRDAPRPIQQGH